MSKSGQSHLGSRGDFGPPTVHHISQSSDATGVTLVAYTCVFFKKIKPSMCINRLSKQPSVLEIAKYNYATCTVPTQETTLVMKQL